MGIETVLKERGWELVQRNDWIAVRDHRPHFIRIFPKGRVGKLVETTFYVTLTPLSALTTALIRDTGATPVYLKSRNTGRDVEYPGLDTSTVSEEKLTTFFVKLFGAIDELL